MSITFAENMDCLVCDLKSPLFNHLSEPELHLLNQNKSPVFYRKGETIRKQGAVLTHVISVNKGLAKVYLESPGSSNLLLSLLAAPAFIGGPGMFTDKKHHFTVTALSDLCVCFIEMSAFRQLLQSNNQFLEAYLKHISSITLNAYNRLINLTKKQMSGRLADTLLYLSDEIYKGLRFELTLSNSELAEIASMSKDNVVRNLKNFQKEGYIIASGKTIEIVDYDGLRSLSLLG